MIFQYEGCKNNGGFELWGDYSTLRNLYNFAMDVSEKSPYLDGEGLVTALAYDLHKAYDGKRLKEKADVGEDKITIYGVEQIWPTFIVQLALMRTGMCGYDSSKHEQSIMYLLEAYLFDIVPKAFPQDADRILQAYERLIGNTEMNHTKQDHYRGGIMEPIGARVSYFLSLTKVARAKQLSEILDSLNPMWEFMHRMGTAEPIGITPDTLAAHSWDTMPENTKL